MNAQLTHYITPIFSVSPITGSLCRNTNNPLALHSRRRGLNIKLMNNTNNAKYKNSEKGRRGVYSKKNTCFWLEQRADAECVLKPHQLETHTLGHPPFSSALHMSAKDGKMLWVLICGLQNEFQREDYCYIYGSDNAENRRHLSLILFSLCFNWDSGGSWGLA